jgi:hypothetical protein
VRHGTKQNTSKADIGKYHLLFGQSTDATIVVLSEYKFRKEKSLSKSEKTEEIG